MRKHAFALGAGRRHKPPHLSDGNHQSSGGSMMNAYRVFLRVGVALLAVGVVLLAGVRFTVVEAQTIVIDDANNTMTVSGANAGTAMVLRGTVSNVSANNYPI